MLNLCVYGCVVTTAELLKDVRQHSIVDIYQSSRHIVRARQGVYACAHITAQELLALRCGGVLDCVWALDAAGLDVLGCGVDLSAVHVRFRQGDHWARSRMDMIRAETGTPITAHWHSWRSERPSALANRVRSRSWRATHGPRDQRGYFESLGNIDGVVPLSRVPAAEALAQALLCIPADQALRLMAEVEDAGALNAAEIDRIVAATPRRTRDALRRQSRRPPADSLSE